MAVTTLIPAYKPHFMLQLLRCLAQQTVRPERVIISDDSPGGVFRSRLQAPEFKSFVEALRPEVIDGPRQGGLENRRRLLKHWNQSTSHVHFLFDDDIVYPNFYERHLKAHAAGRTRCTVSRRWIACQAGDPASLSPLPRRVADHSARLLYLSTEFLVTSVFEIHPISGMPFNWLGELSHAVFSEDCAHVLGSNQLAGVSYRGLGDLGAFLSCSLDAPLGYLNEYLGVFRLSPMQNTRQKDSLIFRQGILAWFALAIAARRLDRLSPTQTMACFQVMAKVFFRDYGTRSDSQPMVLAINGLIEESPGAQDRFLAEWASYG